MRCIDFDIYYSCINFCKLYRSFRKYAFPYIRELSNSFFIEFKRSAIAFNIKSSDRYSTTRLIQTNYETQAAAASDLGGIEVARNRLVITIGLSTITMNPEAVAIILAAGEAKAKVVKDAIEREPSNVYPATALQKLKNA